MFMEMISSLGFPHGSEGKESACNAGETWIRPLGQEDLLEKGMANHSIILENFMDRGHWKARVHGVTKSQT